MILTILIVIFIVTVASIWWAGLWSNWILLVNSVLSAMAASSFYEPLAAELLARMPTYAAVIPFIAVWLAFVMTFFVLRGITDVLTSMRLQFDFWTETIGRSVLSISVAWVFVCFVMYTLQMAPLPPNWFEGKNAVDLSSIEELEDAATPYKRLQELAKAKPGAFGPDKLWVDFVRSRSRGSFAAVREKGMFRQDKRQFPAQEDGQPLVLESRVYDPLELFFVAATVQRNAVSHQENLRVAPSPP